MFANMPETACCRGCEYLLYGLPEPICPECGRSFDPLDARTYDRSTGRKRFRRWAGRRPLVLAVAGVGLGLLPARAWRGRVVPLGSALDHGSLGVGQLPRTWHKVLLEAAGLLHADYPGLGGGLDQRVVVDVLGLDRDEVNDHLTTARPSYQRFEAWVR